MDYFEKTNFNLSFHLISFLVTNLFYTSKKKIIEEKEARNRWEGEGERVRVTNVGTGRLTLSVSVSVSVPVCPPPPAENDECSFYLFIIYCFFSPSII